MKNAIVVGAYINTDEKEQVLYEALLQLKKLQLPIVVVASSILSNRIIELCDYHIYDKENLLLPVERSPLYWYADDVETVHLYNRGISYVIVKKLGLALHLLQHLKVDNFLYMEYDSIIHDNDLSKVMDMFAILKSKSAFFCQAAQDWLESRIFAGNVKFFLDTLPLPISYEEWITTEPYATHNETLEILFSFVFQNHMDKVAVTPGFNKHYFTQSKIDLFCISKEVNIVYNEEVPDNPILFLIGANSEYDIHINEHFIDKIYLNVGEVKKYNLVLVGNEDTTVKVNFRGTQKLFTINKQSIQEYKILGCRYKL